MRKVYIYDDGESQVEKFFSKADIKIQNKLRFQLEYIKDVRNSFTEPHIKHFTIDRYKELYELRIKAAGTMVRVIFYENDGDILLLYAFYKHDKRDTQRALDTAIKILSSYKADPVRRELMLN